MAILLSTTVAYVQRTANKIILHVDHEKSIYGTNDLINNNTYANYKIFFSNLFFYLFLFTNSFYPMIPTK